MNARCLVHFSTKNPFKWSQFAISLLFSSWDRQRGYFRLLSLSQSLSWIELHLRYVNKWERVPVEMSTDLLAVWMRCGVYTTGGLQAFFALHSSLCSRPDEPPSRPFLYSPTAPVVELDVDSAEMSQILPFLYLGNNNWPLHGNRIFLGLLTGAFASASRYASNVGQQFDF